VSGKQRPTERVLGNLNAIVGQVQAFAGATRGGSAMRGMGGSGGGGSSRTTIGAGNAALPMLQNLMSMNSLLATLVQLTATGIKGRDSTTRASR